MTLAGITLNTAEREASRSTSANRNLAPPVSASSLADAVAPTAPMRRGQWRTWARLMFEGLALGLAIGVGLGLLVLIGSSSAHAQTAGGQPFVAVGTPMPAALSGLPVMTEAPAGSALLFRTTAGLVAAPLQATEVRLKVVGNLVRATVAQRYANPSEDWLDGVYQFPLPDDAAVDSLRMRIGQRTIEGRIQLREAARQAFEQARREGKRASLVSQRRANVFTADVANIEPWGGITIEIEYQQVLALSDSGWVLRFPTVVAPRYEPASRASQMALSNVSMVADGREADAAARQQADPGNEQSTGSQPILLTPDARANRIAIVVDIEPGMEIVTPRSITHPVRHEREGANHRVSFTAEELADRDFELQWAPLAGGAPEASVRMEAFEGDWYGLLVMAPPAIGSITQPQQPREMVFVIDTSGSMHGESLEQAKAALRYGLRRLGERDHFNVIRFDSQTQALFARSQPADASGLAKARAFIDRLKADGGTEMGPALERALLPGVPAGAMGQVVFITDGAVDNEAALFDTIHAHLGDRRLFTVGIGSAPNGWFMRKAAQTGRGTFTFIGATEQVESRMAELFARLAHPMLTSLVLRDAQGGIIATDTPVRDLYAGDPVVHAFRIAQRPDAIFVEGLRNGEPWRQEARVDDAQGSGIHKLWARARMEDLDQALRQLDETTSEGQRAKERAQSLAMRHRIVSAHTSLVAVDTTPARPAGEIARSAEVPRHLPKGWDLEQIVGAPAVAMLPQGATGAFWQMLVGALFGLVAVMFAAASLCRAERMLPQAHR